jgi:hypothetical protein
MTSRQEKPPEAKERVDRARAPPGTVARGCEPAHVAFTVTRRLMRDFNSVVQTAILGVCNAMCERLLSRGVVDINLISVIIYTISREAAPVQFPVSFCALGLRGSVIQRSDQ